MDCRIHRVIEYMQNNLGRNLSLRVMAGVVGISPSRLRHLFKADTGMTPSQYLQALRMRQARHLLESTWLRVKEIGNMVGIAGQSHFVRDFKRAYGLTPASYRANFNLASSKKSPPDRRHL
jgi:AraC-like DNA-binding protein